MKTDDVKKILKVVIPVVVDIVVDLITKGKGKKKWWKI